MLLLKKGNIGAVERTPLVALLLQGLRIAIPAALLLAVPTSVVQRCLECYACLVCRVVWLSVVWYGRCRWLRDGYQHDGDSRSMAILCYRFCTAALSNLTLIAMGTIGVRNCLDLRQPF